MKPEITRGNNNMKRNKVRRCRKEIGYNYSPVQGDTKLTTQTLKYDNKAAGYGNELRSVVI